SLTLRPARLLNRPRRPLSRGFDPASYPAKPLVSYQTYRQLSGWILPPLVIRAFSGHTSYQGISCCQRQVQQNAPEIRSNAANPYGSPRDKPLEPSGASQTACE